MNNNQAIITLILISMISISYCQDYSVFWDNCQEQLINFSVYIDSHPEKAILTNKIFNCPKVWFSDNEERKKCEIDANLDQLDETIKIFYNECFKPYHDKERNRCKNTDGVCASEYDKCTLCVQNPSTCKTGDAMPKSSIYKSILAGDETYCTDKVSDKCPISTLKVIARQACRVYYDMKCSYEYFEANFQEDGCYDYVLCQKNFSILLKIALIQIILAFLVL